jgi:steroid 5-alpha reductase family enzyme
MSYWSVYATAAVTIWFLMTLIWLISLKLKNTSIVDIIWGFGFVLVNWVVFFLTPDGFADRKWILNILVTLWGLRLAIHIFLRNHGKPEDFRYAAWREQYGKKWWWYSYFQTFMLQGLLMFIISAPLIHTQATATPTRIGVLEDVGIFIWAIGFFFETLGDLQLEKFKKNPANKGKLLDYGVWRYTRHPNYFGDSAQWWGFYLIAAGSTLGFLTIFSPIIITYLLIKVSGVVLLEKSLAERKPGYKEYMQTTNAFFPWFPKKIDH